MRWRISTGRVRKVGGGRGDEGDGIVVWVGEVVVCWVFVAMGGGEDVGLSRRWD
jgi:hypothetical protein